MLKLVMRSLLLGAAPVILVGLLSGAPVSAQGLLPQDFFCSANRPVGTDGRGG